MYKSTGEFWRRAENASLDFEQSTLKGQWNTLSFGHL